MMQPLVAMAIAVGVLYTISHAMANSAGDLKRAVGYGVLSSALFLLLFQRLPLPEIVKSLGGGYSVNVVPALLYLAIGLLVAQFPMFKTDSPAYLAILITSFAITLSMLAAIGILPEYIGDLPRVLITTTGGSVI